MSTNVIIHDDLNELIAERQQVWADYDRAHGLIKELSTLSARIPKCQPSQEQVPFAPNTSPAAELAKIVPLINEKLQAAAKLENEMNSCHQEIRSIKQKEKSLIIGLVVGGVLVVVVFVIVLLIIVFAATSH